MPALFEADQVGKRESLADLISVVETTQTPFTSMCAKRKKPNQVIHDWQVKAYRKAGHKGVVDGKDAENFTSNPRERLHAVAQKSWELPAVSDFAEESVVAGLPQGEMAGQIADGLVVVKRILESRSLSNEDCKLDNGTTQGNETRGGFHWVRNTAQALYPVPTAFRTPTASIFTDPLDEFTETAFKAMCRSAYKQRKGTGKVDAFLGVDLKEQVSSFASYSDDVSSKTNVRTFNQNAADKALITVVDRLVMDTGEVDLHLSSFNMINAADGEETNYTHRSGLFCDMSMWGLAFTRMPRVKRLEYKGGGYKAIIDVIFMLMCDNPLGQMAALISTDS